MGSNQNRPINDEILAEFEECFCELPCVLEMEHCWRCMAGNLLPSMYRGQRPCPALQIQ